MKNAERFSVGSIECQVLPDGVNTYPRSDIVMGVPSEQLDAALKDVTDEKGNMLVPYNCLLVRAEGRIALIDSGIGGEVARRSGAPVGRLMESLASVGIMADDVELVVISHAHLDHIGGLTVESGGRRVPVFHKARHYFWQTEWEFWTSEERLAQVPKFLAQGARTHLPAVKEAGLLELVSQETDVLPGVRLLPAPGHTPGHMVVAITSGREGAIYLGDTVLHEVNFDHPEWVSTYESIPAKAVTTRRAMIEKAIREKRLIVAFHMAARGYAAPNNDCYSFRPVAAGVTATG